MNKWHVLHSCLPPSLMLFLPDIYTFYVFRRHWLLTLWYFGIFRSPTQICITLPCMCKEFLCILIQLHPPTHAHAHTHKLCVSFLQTEVFLLLGYTTVLLVSSSPVLVPPVLFALGREQSCWQVQPGRLQLVFRNQSTPFTITMYCLHHATIWCNVCNNMI